MRAKWTAKRAGNCLSDELQDRYDNQVGNILVYDWESDAQIGSLEQGCPFGIFIQDKTMMVCDAKNNSIEYYDCDTFELQKTLTSHYFNDLHSIVKDGDSFILTSSGIDTVARLDSETGYVEPILTLKKKDNNAPGSLYVASLSPTEDFSIENISTQEQSTHLNYAAPLSDGRIGVSLFHQGQIIAYREGTSSYDVLISGLKHSHAFLEYHSKFYVADSGNSSVKVYESGSYKFLKEIPFNGWVQDIRLVNVEGDNRQTSLMAVTDADNARLYFFDLETEKTVKIMQLPANYRIASCVLVRALRPAPRVTERKKVAALELIPYN